MINNIEIKKTYMYGIVDTCICENYTLSYKLATYDFNI